jgi:16S rRNA (cytidine1402-2'-O)-methyltransferase
MSQKTRNGELQQGVLYVVATPIGNLEDITARAVRILQEADVIVCEDTRKSRVLLQRWNVSTQLISLHKFSESRKTHTIVERLEQGQHVALISDAGTPAISDPGARVVRAALDAGMVVSPIPGPSVVTTALSAAGVVSTSFAYLGFAPRKDEGRRKLFDRIRAEGRTAVLLDSPRRIRDTLAVAGSVLPVSKMVLLRELTKVHEEILRGTALTISEVLKDREPIRGEIVLVIDPEAKSELDLSLDQIVRDLIEEGLSGKRLADEAARRFGIKKTDAYNVYLRISGRGRELWDSALNAPRKEEAMKLYLIQHAEPKPKEQDPERGLSDKGRGDAERVAAFLKPLGIRVGAVWHSGKKRAAQTAEILANAVTSKSGVVHREGLAPLDPVEPMAAAIAMISNDMLIAGHLPFLGRLASYLVARSESADVVAFQQGGIVCLERDDDGLWRIRFMITPDLL